MPPLRVVDAHVHFWDPSLFRYGWLSDLPSLQRPFGPTDYSSVVSGETDAVVFVEANVDPSESAAELAFAKRLAVEDPRIVGVVAFIDLRNERTRSKELERLRSSRHVVGVRHNVQGSLPGAALDPAFVRGVQDVGAHGLTFDLCLTAPQLPEVTELVRRCPRTSFVLDHCGKPAIRDNAFEPWAGDLLQLAALPNVECKLSGLLTEARVDQDISSALQPYLDHVVTCFGPQRLLYGSDWPVSTLNGGERVWRALVDRFTVAWSPDEQQAFYADNAIRFYGLEMP